MAEELNPVVDGTEGETEESETGEGSLEGMRCPKCGNTGQFRIVGVTTWRVFSDGTDDHGDVEWDKDSYCECPECGETGVVADFTPGEEPTTAWERDEIQFPRLLAEIMGVGLTKAQWEVLAEAMDLPVERIQELFDRANMAWQAQKGGAE